MTSTRIGAAVAAIAMTAAVTFPQALRAAEITFLCAQSMQSSLEDLMPLFEKESGHKVRTSYVSVIRNTQQVRNGDQADLAIVSPQQWSELSNEGKVTGSAPVLIAKVGAAVAVKKGHPKPDVSSVDAFKQAVLAAQKIALSNPANAPVAAHMVRVFERLGISEAVKPKLVMTAQSFVTLAKGEADLGFMQMSDVFADPQLELAGPLPEDIQNYTVLAAATPKTTREPEAAKALIEFLMSNRLTGVFASKGLSRN